MKSTTDILKQENKVFPAQIVKIINNTRLAINRGSENGIRANQKVLVYCLSDEEIKDPETGESLGYLEIYKGTGKVIHIQDKMSIIESDRHRTKTTKGSVYSFLDREEKVYDDSDLLDFEDPKIGDMVKPI